MAAAQASGVGAAVRADPDGASAAARAILGGDIHGTRALPGADIDGTVGAAAALTVADGAERSLSQAEIAAQP